MSLNQPVAVKARGVRIDSLTGIGMRTKESDLSRCRCIQARPRSSSRRASRGYTLVELVVASTLMILLFAGLQSAVLLAAKAIPNDAIAADLAAQGAAFDRIAEDLFYAKKITRATATELAFTVADRDGDAVDDTIQYTWSGVAGASLLRTFNAAAPEELLAGVGALSFAMKTESVAGVATYVESSETLLAIHSPSTNLAPVTIDSSMWIAQSIPVTLPAGAVDFRTTRARMKMQLFGAPTGTTTVELRSLREQAPTSRTLVGASVDENTLVGAPGWVSIPLASGRYLDPNEQVGVVVRPSAIPPSCQVTVCSAGVAASAGSSYTSTTSGGSWGVVAGSALLYELWGVYRTLDTVPSTTRGTSIIISGKSGTNQTLELNIPLANRPVVGP